MKKAVKTDSYAAIAKRLTERFTILDDFAMATTAGICRALIVSGPPGLGKSYSIEKLLKTWNPKGDQYTVAKGYVRATGLLKLLYQHRKPGNVIVFDDADSVFWDDNSLNLLKSVCDTTEDRYVSYLAESRLVDEDSAELIPSRFLFEGAIIFLTNLDFDKMIAGRHKVAPHLEALVSRAHYIDLKMKTRADFLVRIEQVVKEGEILGFLPKAQQDEVLNFVKLNSTVLRELSLRMVKKIGDIRKMKLNSDWRAAALSTCGRE